jgi:hypothetical protein
MDTPADHTARAPGSCWPVVDGLAQALDVVVRHRLGKVSIMAMRMGTASPTEMLGST